ncbi:ABC transporter ATP-binding protein [Parendozoicomonas haliclonae]|uniref:Iron(3+)-hydroxamate import ATP-binding protein FhuC n=1 Tax=Parendozoicomonas haliclonae TaxID=1960125 RepID=A0A1X7ALY6_9GAMM|nr:ABC transporter ATP-binding protein [Parendozoicomonas haliclonae]SMA48845.1 Iron(3+)-hydroxamate import ATP-binding protein FhuC [Parendozoicomonas haliclonae]
MSQTALQVQKLCWSVNGRQILDSISFVLEPGSFTGLAGANGAGKTSLLRCIYRACRPDSGHVLFEGQDVWQLSARENARQMAVVLQEHHGDFGLTVRDVVAMGLIPHRNVMGWESAAEKQQIVEALEQVNLGDKARQSFISLSGGEKQRALIARALVQKPRLLILDEPTNHLDINYQLEMLQLARDSGITVLASIHDLNIAAQFCDRLLVLNHGRLVADDNCRSVFSSGVLEQAFNLHSHVDDHPVTGSPRISFYRAMAV